MKTRNPFLVIAPIAFAVCALFGTMLDAQTVLTVELDGSGGFTNIQHAIDAAQDGDVVSVGPGEYIVDSPINFNRLHNPADSTSSAVKNLTVKSVSGPWETIIRMAESPADAGRGSVIIFENGESERSRFEGFTVTSGQKSDADIWWTSAGGGVLCRGGSSPFLVSCRIVQNGRFGWIPVLGGGVCIIGSSPTLIGCTIAGNVAGVGGGVGIVSGRGDGEFVWSSVTLENCLIANNRATGVLGDNGGGGVRCYGSSATLINCQITGNRGAWSGGGVNCAVQAEVNLINCEISGNLAEEGAATWCFNDSNMRIVNCTITGNRSLGGRSSVYSGLGATSYLLNSILWSEESKILVSTGADHNLPGRADVRYSCLETETVWPGPGNTNLDPLFISVGQYHWERYTDDDRPNFIVAPGDYRLQATSPCVDLGTAEGAPEFDLEYIRRPCGPGVDLGAYEFCNDESPAIVDIPDAGLLAALRAALNQSTGDITIKVMHTLTDLDASIDTRGWTFGELSPLISSLKGLEAAKNLSFLNLRGNGPWWVPNVAVEDFSPLANLSRLTDLDLSLNGLNGLTSITLPQGFTNLIRLGLSANRLTSIALPERLHSLGSLDLRGNDLTNVTLPKDLTNLTTLLLGDNPLGAADLSFLDQLPALRTLALRSSGLATLELPEELKEITNLDVAHNELTTLTLPAGRNKLTTLDLSGNPITYLAMPFTVDLANLDLSGFDKANVTRYVPLAVMRVGHHIEIAWPDGVLQTMDAIGGSWEEVVGAASPHRVETGGPQKFYRVTAQ